MSVALKLEASWLAKLAPEFQKPYMKKLGSFLRQSKRQKKIIFPKGSDIFHAFYATPVNKVRVVLLGQDPYHGFGQAHGLSFSVKFGVPVPPSLSNIYKALQNDLGIRPATHGCLSYWATQGVLCLNSILTVEQAQPGSHRGKGWEQFTDKVIEIINQKKQSIIFVLWGSAAHKKGKYIDANRHVILKSVHPSPLSAYRGFFTCSHFSLINKALTQQGDTPIDWKLPENYN